MTSVQKNKEGFSLLEIIFAVAILFVLVLMSYAYMQSGGKTSAITEDRFKAMVLAQHIVEDILNRANENPNFINASPDKSSLYSLRTFEDYLPVVESKNIDMFQRMEADRKNEITRGMTILDRTKPSDKAIYSHLSRELKKYHFKIDVEPGENNFLKMVKVTIAWMPAGSAPINEETARKYSITMNVAGYDDNKAKASGSGNKTEEYRKILEKLANENYDELASEEVYSKFENEVKSIVDRLADQSPGEMVDNDRVREVLESAGCVVAIALSNKKKMAALPRVFDLESRELMAGQSRYIIRTGSGLIDIDKDKRGNLEFYLKKEIGT